MKTQDMPKCGFCSFPEKAGRFASPFVLLLIRVVWGWQFFHTGLAKLTHIAATTEKFEGWGIPAPAFHAHFVGGLECVGGLMLVAGLGARIISIPLIVSMTVAILTAHRADVFGTADKPVAGFDMVTNFFDATPGPFLVALLVIFAFGPGLFSADAALRRCLGGESCGKE